MRLLPFHEGWRVQDGIYGRGPHLAVILLQHMPNIIGDFASSHFSCYTQAWSACVDTNRGEGHNFTEECRDATLDLQKCMEEHRDFYKDFMLDSEPPQGPDEGSAPEAKKAVSSETEESGRHLPPHLPGS